MRALRRACRRATTTSPARRSPKKRKARNSGGWGDANPRTRSDGVLECWSAESTTTPSLHHSTTPPLHHSITPFDTPGAACHKVQPRARLDSRICRSRRKEALFHRHFKSEPPHVGSYTSALS